ncbi:hypothetical protein A0128_19605 [Leptospira tipperaryensis]|uniref:Uncharacterized protein n=1 Tax=Leptospira tipperaryensis TaxID=2564040 RepID=A0A1D7V321_9LEPT|nr:hypothetical protein A0128_19605 [Leptospira tipperaryensis]
MIQIQDPFENRNPFFGPFDLLFSLEKTRLSARNFFGKEEFFTGRSPRIRGRFVFETFFVLEVVRFFPKNGSGRIERRSPC